MKTGKNTCCFDYGVKDNKDDVKKVFTKPYIKKKKVEKPITHTFKLLKGWSDVDFQMLHFCFEKLCSFVEEEKGLDSLKYNYEFYENMDTGQRKLHGYKVADLKKIAKENKESYETVKYLYEWWTQTYVPLYKDNKWDGLWDDECSRIEQENLIKLINIRRILWT